MGNVGRHDQRVLDVLKDSGKPISAYDVLARARSLSLKAPVQVYRALQRLEALGLVHRVQALNAFVACTDDHEGLHSPAFVICRDCGSAREFEDGRVASVARRAAGAGFRIDQVSLEIYGHCADCLAAG